MLSIINSWQQLLTLNALLIILYMIWGVIYRLYLCPVAKFPGPRWAAVTFWYEFYYDVVKRGKYVFKIRELHKHYGPVIRINPYELHIDDPDFYDVLYSGPSQRRDKWEWSAKMFGISPNTWSTLPHDHHRLRQKALLPFFSKRSVNQLEPMIQSVIDALCLNIEKYRRTEKPLNLLYAFSAVATDVICQYTFGDSRHNVEKSDFAPEWYNMLMNPSEFSHTMKQFGWLFPLMEATPEWIVRKINKPVYDLIMLQKGYGIQIQDILDGNDKPTENGLKRTIFHEILRSELPAHEKTKERLMAETQLIITAGTVTVTHMLKLTAFFLLDNPDMARKLKDELQSAIPDPSRSASWTQLQNLPYLTAVVHEGLRMSYGVCHRLQRIKPDGSLFFRDWVIPAGTPVSMTSVLMHTNPLIFPNPVEFRPERWLDQEGLRLEKYLVPFSRGTRSCIGSNLAYAEIYMTLATVFRRFDFELFETTRADVDMVHDFFNPCVRLSSKGIRARVKSSVWKG